ncbi:hypothetical protein KEM54_004869 [Ascosphaera aggregata]|nr:hypothetical protein KEM54_004869 [Ascosphaera aggregata]
MLTSSTILRKMTSQKAGGSSTVAQDPSPKQNNAVPNKATPQNGPVLRRKYAVIGRSSQSSVSPSETDVTPMLKTSNPSRAQGDLNASTASLNEWKASEKSIQKKSTLSLHCTTSSASKSLQPHRCSTACLQAAPTSATTSCPTCGASQCHTSVLPARSRARASSSPQHPGLDIQPSSSSIHVIRERPATSSCVNPRPRGRSRTISSSGSTYRSDASDKALPSPPNREGLNKNDTLSYAVFHLGSNHRVSRVIPAAVETKTDRLDSSHSHGSGSVSTSPHSRSPRPGPAAGTGHEGYGKFAPNIRRRKSALRRVRSIHEQDLSRMRSSRAENRISTARNNPSPNARATHVARAQSQPSNTIKGYCISPTPRLDDATISRQSLLAGNQEVAKTRSAPKKKKRSKLNWAFIKSLCGAGCVKESGWRFNEENPCVDSTDCQSIIILPPPPAKDDPENFSLSNMKPQVPPKDRHRYRASNANTYPASHKSNNFYRGRTASDATKPLSFSSSASSSLDYDSDMTEEELWSEYDDLLDDISYISDSLSYGSPYRLVSGQPCIV